MGVTSSVLVPKSYDRPLVNLYDELLLLTSKDSIRVIDTYYVGNFELSVSIQVG